MSEIIVANPSNSSSCEQLALNWVNVSTVGDDSEHYSMTHGTLHMAHRDASTFCEKNNLNFSEPDHVQREVTQ